MDNEKSVAFVAPPLSEKSSLGGGGSENVGSGEDLIEMRANWSNPVEFILSCLNFALGLGNVWRYPYLAYRNGGGAFLIPYFLAAVFIGLPLFFIELLTGQYSGVGPIKAFSFLSPLFKGLGE
jgi:SNF family Na+-dependent transporter